MNLHFKKFLLNFTLNFCFFLMLIIGIQNSSNKGKVNFLVNETVALPISFIIGISFISGSIFGSILPLNLISKRKNLT